MVKSSPVENLAAYQITLSLAGSIYFVEGDTLLDALKKITPTSFGKGYAEIMVRYKNKETKVPIKIFPTKLKRIFNNKWEMELFAKRLNTLR